MIGKGTDTKNLTLAIIGSVLAHVGVIAIVAVASSGRAMKPVPEAVSVKLTRLGKERPKEWLPRKESKPPPPTKQAKTPVLKETKPTPKPTPKPPKKAETTKDKVQNLNRLSNALERLKKYDEPEGAADGSEFGNTSELVDATERAKFIAEVQSCLQRNYSIEGLSADQVSNMSATVQLTIARDGSVTLVGISKSSGDERFDRQVENAARRCKKVSPTPPSIGDAYAAGVNVVFRP